MVEILPSIWTWPWFSEPHGYNFNGYFVADAAGNVAIDPVQPNDEVFEVIERQGVAGIVITNRNHSRSANVLRARTKAPTFIHPADAPHARAQGTEIDGELHPGDTIGPLKAIGVPGKSPGELALHWPQRRILIVGDALIGNPPGTCSLLREQVLDDPARLRESVRTLLELDFDTLLVGDGQPILSGAKQRLAELVKSFEGK